jgi:DNA polymerase V
VLDKNNKLAFFRPNFDSEIFVSLISQGINAGFPSPAADFEEEKISLDAFLIKNKEATFYAKASGNSMINAGINDGDILVIDRSLPVTNNKIAICFVDGEFTVKRIAIQEDKILLLPENPNYKPIEVSKENEFVVWGIVTYVIKKLI